MFPLKRENLPCAYVFAVLVSGLQRFKGTHIC